jgi:PPOX class probable F420-dependent enzyme
MSNIEPSQIEAFLAEPNLARFATISRNGYPHVVPVWFLWEDGAVWISAYRSTRKAKHLLTDRRCALVVDVKKAEHGVTGVLFEGEAELFEADQPKVRQRIEQIYLKYLGPEGILDKDPQDWLASPENMLIKLTPKHTASW